MNFVANYSIKLLKYARKMPIFIRLGFTERDSNRVNIHGVDPEALTVLVDYVYTSQVLDVSYTVVQFSHW